MPIKGLTNRMPQFPEIGQIRKGQKRDPEKPLEKLIDLDYFRIEVDPEETAALLEIHRVYTDKPKVLDILRPFPAGEQNWITWREAYLAGGLIHRCDGETVQYEIDNRTGEKIVEDGLTKDGKQKFCNGKTPVGTYETEKEGKKITKEFFCKPVGRLKLILPVLSRAVFFTLLTSSQWDIAHLDEQLSALYLLNGKLSGIPLKLRRRDREVSCPTPEGRRVRRTKSLLSIEADPAWTKQRLLLLKAASLPGNGIGEELPLLEPPQSATSEEMESEGDAELGSPVEGGDFGTETDLEESQLPEIPYPAKLTPDVYYEFAKKKKIFEEAQAIMRENKLDLRKSWASLLRSHVPPEEWPR
jgi:hypothetical protein